MHTLPDSRDAFIYRQFLQQTATTPACYRSGITAWSHPGFVYQRDSAHVTTGYIVADVERLREPLQRITHFILNQEAKPVFKAQVVNIRRSQLLFERCDHAG
jgi:hypothetical protein